ncbi:MAG: response regulator [Longimicrobiales bacterium]
MSRILVVDDNAEFRRGLAKALRQHGYDVTEAGDGREAMAFLRKNPPDLVITDINMPEMDGIEILNELRVTKTAVPVVAISGGGLVPKSLLLGNASVLGAVETIEKPFELATLLRIMERLLAGGGE